VFTVLYIDTRFTPE